MAPYELELWYTKTIEVRVIYAEGMRLLGLEHVIMIMFILLFFCYKISWNSYGGLLADRCCQEFIFKQNQYINMYIENQAHPFHIFFLRLSFKRNVNFYRGIIYSPKIQHLIIWAT